MTATCQIYKRPTAKDLERDPKAKTKPIGRVQVDVQDIETDAAKRSVADAVRMFHPSDPRPSISHRVGGGFIAYVNG